MEANFERKRRRPEAVGVEEKGEVERKKQRSEKAREDEGAEGTRRSQPALTTEALEEEEEEGGEIARSHQASTTEEEAGAASTTEEEEAGGTGRSQPASKTEGVRLPEDLVLRVFSGLPARSVFRYSAASKTWNGLLSSSFFWGSSHRAPASELHMAYAIDATASNRFSFHSEELGSAFTHHFASQFTYRYIGTSSGMVAFQVSRLVGPKFTSCLIANPATQIESTFILLRLDNCHQLCGFGYCASAKAFKILMLNKSSLLVLAIRDGMAAQPRRVCTVGLTSFDPSICLGNAVYLMESTGTEGSRNPKILCFKLSEEIVHKVDLPVEGQAPLSGLIVVAESLWLASRGSHNPDVVLWRLTQGETWEKMLIVVAPTQTRVLGAWISPSNQLVLWYDGWGAMLYHTTGHDSNPVQAASTISYEDHFNSAREDMGLLHSSSSTWGSTMRIAICWGYRPTTLSPITFFSNCGAGHHCLVSFVAGSRVSGAPRLNFVRNLCQLLDSGEHRAETPELLSSSAEDSSMMNSGEHRAETPELLSSSAEDSSMMVVAESTCDDGEV